MTYGFVRVFGVELGFVVDDEPFAGWMPRLTRAQQGDVFLHWRRIEIVLSFPGRIEAQVESRRKETERAEIDAKGGARSEKSAGGDPAFSGARRGHADAHGGEFSVGRPQ